jgi:hypothetical protein
MNKLLLLLFLLVLFTGGSTAGQNTDTLRGTPSYTVFLMGDAGAPAPDGTDPNLNTMRTQMQAAGRNSAVVYLGDNIYQRGLPDPDKPDRPVAERKISAQLDILKNYPGRPFFIPGNHDWDRMGREGWQRVQNQAQFIHQYLGRDDVFLPQGGCPGPVEVPLNDRLVLVILDTQWYLHAWDKPGEESDCEAKDLTDMLVQLDDIIERNIHKRIIVAGHHPMYTYGPHGRYYTWKNHLFPFLDVKKHLYIPLPVLGSLYPLYRQLIGSRQDLPHPLYQQMQRGITAVLRQHPQAIWVNGHEHALQHIVADSIHYITSGSGSKMTPVKKGRLARYVTDQVGFARVDYYPAGEAWLSFWKPDKDKPEGERLYESQLMPAYREQAAAPDPADRWDYRDTTVVMAASNVYEAGAVRRFFLGKNYRQEWTTPVTVPVLKLGREAGGLSIDRLGGGMQTRSLRLQAKDGRQYVLRTVEKFAENAIPENLRSAFVVDIVQDQISAAHPFAALAVPPLAEAAGIMHTNPKLVFIPDDPRLGKYRKAFANTLALFEERPDDGFGKTNLFGGAEKIYSTTKMLEKLYGDSDNRVDQRAVLRARLFDMLIGDWDRHDDQWRWAVFEGPAGKVFKPVPRDRDQAFFVNDGLLPWLASRQWVLPKIQGFDYRIQNVTGFNFNARYFDRSFLNEPGLADWKAMADTLRQLLPDSVIERAIRTSWPEAVFTLSGEKIISKLKRRRDDLAGYAETHYQFLAREVDVVGSDKNERFAVERLPGGDTRVTVHKVDKEGNAGHPLYERTFTPAETREVRLYGLDGDDQFVVYGQARRGIRVRIIGGKGKDRITDSSRVAGPERKTLVYDTRGGTTLKLGRESRNLTGGPLVNEYNRKSFRYNYLAPLLSVQYNPDDGIFLGGGFIVRKQGFRHEPFVAQHRATANYAVATRAYNFRYTGDFTDVIGRLNLQLNAEVRAPNFVNNFFGLGNETGYDKSQGINYYRVRFEDWAFNALLQHTVSRSAVFFAGPAFESVEVERSGGRYIDQLVDDGLENGRDLFARKTYGGVKAGFEVDTRNSKILPLTGVHWHTEGTFYQGLNAAARGLSRIQSDLSFYWSFRLPARVTLATRFGGGVNLSDYEFFQANALGGLTNLRGYRRTRFAGGSSFFNNTEVRVKVFTFRSYFFPSYAGLLAFHDAGRVWQDGETSNRWHRGYGGGLWLTPFNALVVSAMYGFSPEGGIPMLRVGFFF